MRLAWGLEEPIGRYLSAQFPELMRFGEYQPDLAAGFVDNAGVLFGAVGLRFDNAWDAQLSIYVERRGLLTASVLRELFTVAFGRLQLVRLTCRVAKGNRRARDFVERLGFRLEGSMRRAFDGRRDAMVYGMTATECRWLKEDGHAGPAVS